MEKTTTLKIFYSVVAVICLLLLCNIVAECTNDIKEGVKLEIEQYRKQAREHLQANDSLKEIVFYVKHNDSIKAIEILQKESEISVLRSRLSDRKKEAAKDYPKFFSERYDLPITITPEPAKQLIADDLIEGDIAREEVILTRQVVNLQTDRLEQKDVIIGTQGQIITNLESAVTDFESSLNAADVVIDNQEKAIKKERRAKNAWKVATGMALIGGFILGVQ